MSTEIPRLTPVIISGVCVGHLVSVGPRGFEAFDRREQSLGIFQNASDAVAAVNRAMPSACPRCGE
jgi:hypothetical protein